MRHRGPKWWIAQLFGFDEAVERQVRREHTLKLIMMEKCETVANMKRELEAKDRTIRFLQTELLSAKAEAEESKRSLEEAERTLDVLLSSHKAPVTDPTSPRTNFKRHGGSPARH
jgi:predicted RNase H-like nuclease (RuvC/YqgF family)